MPRPNVSNAARSSGRPRSDAARVAVLAATIKLLKTSTVQEVSIEAIAEAAGVSKATIYRWWKTKASVVIDAFLEHHLVSTPMPHDVGAIKALSTHIRLLVEQYSGQGGKIVAQIIAEGQSYPPVLVELRERFLNGRRLVVREVIERGKREGEIRKDLDTEFIMDLLYAPIYLRLLWGHLPLDDDFARVLPHTAFKLISAKPLSRENLRSIPRKTR